MDTLDILDKDHELKSELVTLLSSNEFQAPPSSALNDQLFRNFVLSSLEKPSEKLPYETKSIVYRVIDRYGFTHPVLLIQNDFVHPMPKSEIIAQRIKNNQESIKKAIRASGRVERADGDNSGTAWIVSEGIAVTNRHVVEYFSKKDASGNFALDAQQYPDVKINFKAEYGSTAESCFSVTKILYVASDVDLAFLQVRKGNQHGEHLPTPILLDTASQVSAGEEICVIGYPAKDEKYPDQELMNKLFNFEYDVKQFSTGQATIVDRDIVCHNCNTLPGNSGSVVFSWRHSKAVGIHYKGYDSNDFITGKNYAIPASVIAKRLVIAKQRLS